MYACRMNTLSSEQHVFLYILRAPSTPLAVVEQATDIAPPLSTC